MATDSQVAKTRRDKNDYYLQVAKAIAQGSSCPPGKNHGCIAVKHNRIVATGYNGPPAGHAHCGVDCPLDVYKKRYGKKNFALCPAVHAEINCILTAAVIGTAIEGAVLYITKAPCEDCLKALKNLHLSGIVFFDNDEETHKMLLGPYLLKGVDLYGL
jgi:dCMP deaminase